MSKPFFYRIIAADFLAAVVTVPEQDRASWVLSLALDMVSGDSGTAKSQFAKNIIEEAGEFKEKKAAAGRKGGQAKASSAKAVLSSVVAKPSTPLASSSTEAVTITKPKPLKTVCRFTPPTLEEVKAYCQERNNFVDPEKFIDFYESKGWMVGRNKMKSWKASVRTWEKDTKKPDNMTIPKPIGGFRESDI